MKTLPSFGLIILIASGHSSCSLRTEYTEPVVHIQHSSPDVISLYNKPAQAKPTVAGKVGSSLLDGFIDGLFGSSPVDDDHFGRDRYQSHKEKREYLRNNRASLQKSLRNKR